MQQGMAGAERIFEVLDVAPVIKEAPDPKPLRTSNKIAFEHVDFFIETVSSRRSQI